LHPNSEIYHEACRGAVAVAALWKEKSDVKAKLLSEYEARRIAANIAKLPDLLDRND